MAAGRSNDSTMLYTVIIFVALFIASTVLAVVFFLKITDFQKTVQQSEKQIDAMANAKERRTIGAIAGKELPRNSAMGSLLARFDDLTAMILGTVPENTSAEAKLEIVKQQTNALMSDLADIVGTDANSAGLLRTLELLKGKFDGNATQLAAVSEKLAELEKLFDDEKKAAVEKENEMVTAMQTLRQDANSATSSYENLKTAMQQNSDRQVATIAAQLDQADQNLKKEQQEFLLTQAKLKNAESRIESLQSQLETIMPKPDNLSAALKPDGKIISVDDSTQTVIINLGRDNHVYRGLTFAVYDKSLPIPPNGKGKATIEVFDVQKSVSVARITRANKKDPVMADDNIANLIWAADARREFAVAGDFAFGEGIATVKQIISNWGGIVADKVSITTNFLVLGTAPRIPAKPTTEEVEADPRAKEKYESALQKQRQYTEIIAQATTLSVPVFDLERFLDFVGYTNSTAKK
ncbi:MAG: hypothetical protein Q7T18_09475 [Sedimentisphaerales bacterium]|nr:hypothetical protein [Sedimentisphaerales bacterium]